VPLAVAANLAADILDGPSSDFFSELSVAKLLLGLAEIGTESMFA
jgi:hypothetical protein